MRSLVWGVATLALALTAAPARASFTKIAEYRLGEDDAGATLGGAGNATTTDSVGSYDLTKAGTPTYADPLAGGLSPTSTLAVDFPGTTSRYTRSVLPLGTDDFVIQGYVVQNSGTNLTMVYNGSGGSNGMGIATSSGGHSGSSLTWCGLFGGRTYNDTYVPVVYGVPFHIAVVRDSGTNRIYVNGELRLTTTPTTSPNSATGSFYVGALDGRVDEIQVGTLGGQNFNPATDLNFVFHDDPSMTLLYSNSFETSDVGKWTTTGNVGISTGYTTHPDGSRAAAFNGGQLPHNGVITSSAFDAVAGAQTYIYFNYGNYSAGGTQTQSIRVEVLDAGLTTVLYSQEITDGFGATNAQLYSPFVLPFVPTVDQIRLRFTDFGGISGDGSDGLLDNIRVTRLPAPAQETGLIPEPASLGLFTLALIGLKRRRRR